MVSCCFTYHYICAFVCVCSSLWLCRSWRDYLHSAYFCYFAGRYWCLGEPITLFVRTLLGAIWNRDQVHAVVKSLQGACEKKCGSPKTHVDIPEDELNAFSLQLGQWWILFIAVNTTPIPFVLLQNILEGQQWKAVMPDTAIWRASNNSNCRRLNKRRLGVLKWT